MTEHRITVSRVQYTWVARCSCGWRVTMQKTKADASGHAMAHRRKNPR